MASIDKDRVLQYHKLNDKPGKLSIQPTKPLETQLDLGLAYTPGVAYPVLEIEREPALAYEYTSKGNLVAVITNGTAILGLGHRGALASKPVMEGKAVLFKKFADIDSIDIEIDSTDPETVIAVTAAMREICLAVIEPGGHPFTGMFLYRRALEGYAGHPGLSR